MFTGHFAIVFILARVFLQVPTMVPPIIGVSFPDLIWPILVFATTEKVRIDKNSPLQMHIIFEKYPYSHSLVLTSLIAPTVGIALALMLGGPSSSSGLCLGL
ncbi:MAG TPA: hypothetical protein VN455_09255 [Methanotrichaceae archaeon]|nr:hypothetical protein [Methanotrichaceae archaeon]